MPANLHTQQTVGERVLRNYDFLRRLSSSKSDRQRLKMVEHASADELLALVAVSANVWKGHFHLTHRQWNRILPFAPFVSQLAAARSERAARNRVQVGGGVAALAPLLLPVLAEAAIHLIHRVAEGGNHQQQ